MIVVENIDLNFVLFCFICLFLMSGVGSELKPMTPWDTSEFKFWLVNLLALWFLQHSASDSSSIKWVS